MKAGALPGLNMWIAVALIGFAVGCGDGGKAKDDAASETPAQLATKAADAESPSPAPPAAAPSIDRCAWNRATLTESYLKTGHRDPAWDEPATNALSLFGHIRCNGPLPDEGQNQKLAAFCKAAVEKGCVDPMILYLHTRYVLDFQEEKAADVLAGSYQKSVAALGKYPCATIREFYISLRTSEWLNHASGNRATLPEVHRLRHAAFALLKKALQDPEIPAVEACEATQALLDAVDKHPVDYGDFYRGLAPILMAKWSGESFVFILKGRYHVHEGWRARGTGYADTVTKEGWKILSDHLERAAEALEKGWRLDPSNPIIAREMMRVELGQGQGRNRMELWFDRAMSNDTNNYEACTSKLYYLEPKWYGSAEEMLRFGRECVASTTWGGRVPLILAQAHTTLAAYAKREGNTNYWKEPEVWRDLRPAYEKFFALNPDAVGWRHDYARHAYLCEQWDVFNKQLTYFQSTNHSFFGGKDSFDQMVKTAQRKAGTTAGR